MTTLYKPVRIESVEQAEALPMGTIAGDGENLAPYFKFVNWWFWGADGGLSPRTPVGLTALVPVEAEERHRDHPTRVEEREGHAYLQPVRQVRYVTPWEDA